MSKQIQLKTVKTVEIEPESAVPPVLVPPHCGIAPPIRLNVAPSEGVECQRHRDRAGGDKQPRVGGAAHVFGLTESDAHPLDDREQRWVPKFENTKSRVTENLESDYELR